MNFENTEVAFKAKSNFEIKKAWFLFWLLSFPWFVGIASKITLFLLAIRFPISWLIRRTLYQQFCGGSNRTECLKTVKQLARFHIGTILDYAIEGAKEEAVFDATKEELIQTVLLAKDNPAIPFSVFKITGVMHQELLEKIQSKTGLTPAEKESLTAGRERVEELCQVAFDNNVAIFIDAEESWIQGAIDEFSVELMQKFNRRQAIVYNTLQMYRTDRLAYLEKLLKQAKEEKFILGLKLVRGAYMEKERDRAKELGVPSPVFETKEETDSAFDESLKICVENLSVISLCAGTHNQKSTAYLLTLMEKNKVSVQDKRIYFSQLYGMGDHLTYNLAAGRYNVAKYVPYGPVRAMMPYLFRRAQENSSIRGQTTRELELVSLELKRRRNTPCQEPLPREH